MLLNRFPFGNNACECVRACVCSHRTQCINCCFISGAEALTGKTTASAENTERKIKCVRLRYLFFANNGHV